MLSDVLFVMFIGIIVSIVFLFLLWSPTVFVVVRKGDSGYPRRRLFAFALAIELAAAATLALLVNWSGLLNPAAYFFAITIGTGVLGAIGVRRFLKRYADRSAQLDT
jgi:hypothetical protein